MKIVGLNRPYHTFFELFDMN